MPSDPPPTPSDPTGALLDPTGALLDPTGALLDPTGALLDPTGALLDPPPTPSDPTPMPSDPPPTPSDPPPTPSDPRRGARAQIFRNSALPGCASFIASRISSRSLTRPRASAARAAAAYTPSVSGRFGSRAMPS